MAHTFYPFVENGADAAADMPSLESMVVYPARVAVYDDAAAAPRVVVVEPRDVRTYLEEITQVVTKLSHEQGGKIPFMVMREIVENYIHAYFMSPTISILDDGNTIRFSDQGPGIASKERALVAFHRGQHRPGHRGYHLHATRCKRAGKSPYQDRFATCGRWRARQADTRFHQAERLRRPHRPAERLWKIASHMVARTLRARRGRHPQEVGTEVQPRIEWASNRFCERFVTVPRQPKNVDNQC